MCSPTIRIWREYIFFSNDPVPVVPLPGQRTEAEVCNAKTTTAPKIAKRRVSSDLTARVASEDISSGFIVQEDEEGVGERAEPPARPKGTERTERLSLNWKVTKRDNSALRRLVKRLGFSS